MLREDLDRSTTFVGLDRKVLAGVVFAEVVDDAALAADVLSLAGRNGVSPADLDEVTRSSRSGALGRPRTDDRTVLVLARAASSSPAAIDHDVLAACRDAHLSCPAIVEVFTWIAVLQMLHWLTCSYGDL